MTLQATTASNQVVTFEDESFPHSAQIKESYRLDKLFLNSICGAVLLVKPVVHETVNTQEIHPQIQEILNEIANIFAEPTELPPKRECDHSIPLMPDAKAVNQRPYKIGRASCRERVSSPV